MKFLFEKEVDLERLYQETEKFKQYSYSPYSKFRVACSIVATMPTNEKILVMGANVENASYGLTICAERAALVELNQYKPSKIDFIMVAADGDQPAYPCGACRQFISEFAEADCLVYVGSGGILGNKATIKELLPNMFKLTGR